MCERLRDEDLSELFSKKTGLQIDPYFSGTKTAWLLDNVDGARDLAGRGELAFGAADSWLVWNLTGGRLHVSDISNASRTLLFNIHELDWDDELLSILDIPRNILPQVVPSSGVPAQSFSGCAMDWVSSSQHLISNRWPRRLAIPPAFTSFLRSRAWERRIAMPMRRER